MPRNFPRSRVISAILLLTIVLILVSDVAGHLIYVPRTPSCEDYVVIDVYGVLRNTSVALDKCYTTGMSTLDYRALGKIPAKKIVLVTHYFTRNNTLGIGTSDEATVLFVILHPVSSLLIETGRTLDGKKYIVATPSLNMLSDNLNNKEIIVITCSAGFEKMAQALLERGADVVVVSSYSNLDPEKAVQLVEKSVKTMTKNLCTDLEFICFNQ